jgi:Holliday junction resolvase-like predicted endonuclease
MSDGMKLKVNTSHVGRLAEMRAMVWLVDQGYEVFDNISRTGPIDIVAVKKATGEILLLDVKKVSDTVNRETLTVIRHVLKEDQRRLGVKLLLCFMPSGTFQIVAYDEIPPVKLKEPQLPIDERGRLRIPQGTPMWKQKAIRTKVRKIEKAKFMEMRRGAE